MVGHFDLTQSTTLPYENDLNMENKFWDGYQLMRHLSIQRMKQDEWAAWINQLEEVGLNSKFG